MKKNWLFALLCCCMCAFAVSCSDDDDDVVSGNDDQTENEGGSSSDAAPTVLVTTNAGSDSFTVNITVSSDAYQYGYVASTTSLSSVSAANIISNSVGGYSSGVYTASSDGTFKSVVVDASESTTYYVYAAAVSAGGTYSSVVSGTVTTSAAATTYNVTLVDGLCYYYGNYFTESSNVEYYVLLSDNELTEYVEGGTYYVLDLISATAPSDSESITIPAGTYTLGGSYAANELNYEYSLYGIYDSSSSYSFDPLYAFASGSVTVTSAGAIEGTLTDEYGNVHNISYSGDIYMYDATSDYYYSTLESNVEFAWTGGAGAAYYEGDVASTGTSVLWELELYNSAQTEAIIVSVFGDNTATYSAGIPTGTFTVDDTYSGEAGTCVPGYFYEYDGYYYAYYSWYITFDASGYMDTYSPFGEGTVTISNTDGTYTVTVDVMDDSDQYTIKGTWTGTPTLTDYTTETSSVSTQSLKSAAAVSARPVSARFAVQLNNPAFSKAGLR